MKRFLSMMLIAVLALGLMATGALAEGAEIKDVTAVDGKATVTLTAKDVTYQSAYIEVTYSSGLKLESVTASDGAKEVNTVSTADQVEGVTKMFAWNTADGVTKIAYANGSSVTASSSGTAMFVLEFSGATADSEVKADITFYDASADASDPKEIPVEVTGNIKASASAVLMGDVNGDGKVRAVDALLVLRRAAGLIDDSGLKVPEAADVNGDGKIRAVDALLILRIAAGLS